MSIQSEINRISGNVDDALAATAEMGAEVPATANSNNLGALIRSIPKSVAVPIVEAISTDGVTYTATVPNLTEYYKGFQITIIPNTTSTSRFAKLDVNGLGAKQILFNTSRGTSGSLAGITDDFLSKGIAVTLTYANTAWRLPHTISNADYMYGKVPVANGGTGRETLTSGYYLVGNGTDAVTLKRKDQVLTDIGALGDLGTNYGVGAGANYNADQFKTSGFYEIDIMSSYDPVEKCHLPAADGTLLVLAPYSTCISQLFFDTKSARMYFRTYNSAWSDWKRLVTEDELSALESRIAALEAGL